MHQDPALSPLARKALATLKEGGQFRYALEKNSYTGREQFKARLKNAAGQNVRGIGIATMLELRDRGLIAPCHWTSVSTYYRLKPDDADPAERHETLAEARYG